jgi:hypothetical protein
MATIVPTTAAKASQTAVEWEIQMAAPGKTLAKVMDLKLLQLLKPVQLPVENGLPLQLKALKPKLLKLLLQKRRSNILLA